MIMERYDHNLKDWIDETEDISSQTKEHVIEKLVEGLHYLHSTKKHCHADLKPENILVRADHLDTVNVAVTDFGLSICYESPVKLSDSYRPGTAPYNGAPDECLTHKFDMWSLGLLVYYILKSGVTSMQLAKLSCEAKSGGNNISEFTASLTTTSKDYVTIIHGCLHADAAERVSMDIVHSKISSVDIPGTL